MIAFANAKINIGLQVIRRRHDGYHDLETVFYPLGIYDIVEVIESGETMFQSTGITIPGGGESNLCLQAYNLVKAKRDIPPVAIHLHKVIPVGAGLGGGSANAAAVLRLLNDLFALAFSDEELMELGSQLGADCPFFIRNKPVFATGIGNVFEPLDLDLSSYHIVVVKPDVHVNTAEAYRQVTPHADGKGLAEAIQLPVVEWKGEITNDFEPGMTKLHPVIGEIRELLYEAGAQYAGMSGSGSSVFGIFDRKIRFPETFAQHKVFYIDGV